MYGFDVDFVMFIFLLVMVGLGIVMVAEYINERN